MVRCGCGVWAVSRCSMRVLVLLLAAAGAARGGNTCDSKNECGKCIQDPKCSWCPADKHVGFRCIAALSPGGECGRDVINPQSSIDNVEDKEFSTGSNSKPVVQLRPQKLKILARPGHPVKFQFQYKPAEQYPLDLYYLADYSYSMDPYKVMLQDQGVFIYDALRKITDNVVMGIGSFVEKPALPYSSKYKVSYAFKNHLSLTKNTSQFSTKVSETKIGGNEDNPEASLDALLQVMVCPKEIGWRMNTTRLIVLTTDGPYHSAGDGKMIGIIRPHDGNCHLVLENGEYGYARSLDFDYPSIALINKVARENNFLIFFAAPTKVMDTYKELTKAISGSKYVKLGEPETVVELIKTEYQKMLRSFHFMTERVPYNVKITFDPDCTKAEVPEACKIHTNGQVTVTATLEVDACPKETSTLINIKPAGNPEVLTIDLHYICDCSGASRSYPLVTASDKCGLHGDYQYGSCYCHEGWNGENCECSGRDPGTINNDRYIDKCTPANGELCMGRGECVCGGCVCAAGYSGAHCECNDRSCVPARPGGPPCSGEKNGICRCGACECKRGFNGSDCSCTTDKDSCIDVLSNKECSGHGHCECGQCVCNQDPQYYGPFCEQCRGCPEDHCEILHECVNCVVNIKHNCNCTFGTPEVVERFEDMKPEMAKIWDDSHICRSLVTGASCNILFKYKLLEKSKQVDVLIQKSFDCSKQNEVLMYIGGLVAALVLVPLLTLLAWKLLTHAYDKREYARFRKELDSGEWAPGENPLYDTPTTTTHNPAYNKE